jgi:hypothetical protein
MQEAPVEAFPGVEWLEGELPDEEMLEVESLEVEWPGEE